VRPLRVGVIDYINVMPITVHLGEVARGLLPRTVELVSGEPSRLNALLAEGAIDVAPVSSIEYARHQSSYVLLPDLSIASRGNVNSVLLFSRVPLAELDGRVIGICSATATSVVLLQVLMEDFLSAAPSLRRGATVEAFEAGAYPALLLIGDEALRFRARAAGVGVYDLGGMWMDATGLPMVFAVWTARRDADAEALAALSAGLRGVRDRGLTAEGFREAAARTGLSDDELAAYYKDLHYDLEPDAVAGLETFYEHAARKGLCDPCPHVEFLGRERISR